MANVLNRVRVGRYKVSADEAIATITAGRIQGNIFQPAAENFFADRFRARIGRPSGGLKPNGIFGVYEAGGGSAPDDLYAESDGVFLLSEIMDDPDGGVVLTKFFNWTRNEGTLESGWLAVESGLRLALMVYVSSTSGNLNIGKVTAATGDEPNENAYWKTLGDVGELPAVFGAVNTIASFGTAQAWIEGWENLPPVSPSSIFPTGEVSSVTPEIGGRFRDRNGTYGATSDTGIDSGDHLNRAEVEVRRKSDNRLEYTSVYSCSQAEIDDEVSRRVYGTGGAINALVRGTTYKVRVRHSDHFDEFGSWSDYQEFTPASLGSIDLTGLLPSGKTDALQPNYNFRWNHSGGLGLDRAQLRLYKDGALLGTGTEHVVSVANGATGFIPHGTIFAIGDLIPGGNYEFSIRGRDTGLAWSQYSPRQAFNVDASPGVPSNLSPIASQVISSAVRPSLMATVTDSDDAPGDVTVKFRIKNSGGTILQTRNGVYQAGTNPPRYRYDTIAADFNVVGTYKFDVYSFDGYLYSGGVTVEANAVKSGEATFVWAVIPTVDITSHNDGGSIATDTPIIIWTVTNQTTYQVRVIRDADGVVLWDTGIVANTATRQVTVPAGILHHGDLVDFEVIVVYSSVSGSNRAQDVLVDYPAPAFPGGLTATIIRVGDEKQFSAVDLDWNAYTGSAFAGWLIERSDLDHPLQIITAVGETHYTDYHAPGGVEVSYSVRVLESFAGDTFSSVPAEVSANLQVEGFLIVSASNPEGLRIASRSWRVQDFQSEGDEAEYLTWGGDAPTAVQSPQSWMVGSVSVLLAPEEIGDVAAARAAIVALGKDGGTVSYRDQFQRLWMRIPRGGVKLGNARAGRVEAEISLRASDYFEGWAPPEITET
jgi:hypothetical protein